MKSHIPITMVFRTSPYKALHILVAHFICKTNRTENNDSNIKGLVIIQNAMERGQSWINFQTH